MATAFALDMVTLLSGIVIILSLSLLVVLRHYRSRVSELEAAFQDASSSRRSLATTYGRITEQFAPFLPSYPFEPKNFRFLGSPIDGVQFEEDRVVFVEIKASNSRLTEREARIRDLVQQGRVEWLEFRVNDPAAHVPPGAEDAPADAGDDATGAWSRSSSWGAER